MKLKRSKRVSSKERGSALLIALFALLLVSAIGFGMLYSSNTETNVNANFRDSQRAYFAARAGLEEARQRLLPTSASPAAIAAPAGPPTTSAANIIYLTNPTGSETIDPTSASSNYFDNELCHESFTGLSIPFYGVSSSTDCKQGSPAKGPQSSWLTTLASASPGTGAADALPYKWVRVTTKENTTFANFPADPSKVSSNPNGPVCWDGLHQQVIAVGASCAAQTPLMYPVWVLTSLGVGPQGSHRLAQMEVALDPPIITNAAVDSQAAVETRGSLTVDAYDNCTCNATRDNPGCDKSKYAIYTQGTLTENGNPTLTSGATPTTVSLTDPSHPPDWPYDIDALINKYKNMPTATTPSGACSGSPAICDSNSATTENWGAVDSNFNPLAPTDMNPQITYLPGNTRLNGVTGAGILIVDGDLDIHGGLEWYGLVLVRGTIDFTGGGSDHVNLYGAFLNGKDINAVNNMDDLGGSVNIHFDSCALKQFDQKYPPRNIASHELMY
jgi:Tfp pilus assembly protein PilX